MFGDPWIRSVLFIVLGSRLPLKICKYGEITCYKNVTGSIVQSGLDKGIRRSREMRLIQGVVIMEKNERQNFYTEDNSRGLVSWWLKEDWLR